MTARVPVAACGVALTLLLPAPAVADRIKDYCRWSGNTISYYNAAQQYAPYVRAAARAWNRSGARVRWVRAPRSRARVIISIRKGLYNWGFGGCSSPRRGYIWLAPGIFGFEGEVEPKGVLPTRLIAHEMGHVMGLDHEERRCTLMNATINQRPKCPEPGVWQWYCRILEPDDVRGAVRIYGGRPRAPARRMCTHPAPPAPRDVRARWEPSSRRVRISWRAPRSRLIARVVVGSKRGGCAGRFTEDVHESRARRGATAIFDGPFGERAPGGRYCYAVNFVSPVGRDGRIATASYERPPPAPRPPVAGFTSYDQGQERRFLFFNRTQAPDGDIVRWLWDFGDGQTATVSNPDHQYSADGTYTVTLTVHDEHGLSDSYSEAVDVQYVPPPPEEPQRR